MAKQPLEVERSNKTLVNKLSILISLEMYSKWNVPLQTPRVQAQDGLYFCFLS